MKRDQALLAGEEAHVTGRYADPVDMVIYAGLRPAVAAA